MANSARNFFRRRAVAWSRARLFSGNQQESAAMMSAYRTADDAGNYYGREMGDEENRRRQADTKKRNEGYSCKYFLQCKLFL